MVLTISTVFPLLAESDYAESLACRLSGMINVATVFGRCDVVTSTHAWEVKVAKQWRHAFGQALTYGLELCRYPGVCLIDPSGGVWREMVLEFARHLSVDVVAFVGHRYEEWIVTQALPRRWPKDWVTRTPRAFDDPY